jgi:hypothetical protein
MKTFWKSSTDPAPVARELTRELERKLVAFENAADKNPFEEEVLAYSAKVRNGEYQGDLFTDDLGRAVDSVVHGIRLKNLITLGMKQVPGPMQVSLLFDPPQGTGAGIPATIAELDMDGLDVEGAEFYVIGFSTCYNESLHRRLRLAALVPTNLSYSPGRLTGEFAVHYGFLPDGASEPVIRRLVQRMDYRDGVFNKVEPELIEAPPGRSTQLIKAAFAANKGVAGTHARFRRDA